MRIVLIRSLLIFLFLFFFKDIHTGILNEISAELVNKEKLKINNNFELNYYFIFIFLLLFAFFFMNDNNLLTSKTLNNSNILNTLSINEHTSNIAKTNLIFFKKSFEILKNLEIQNFLSISEIIFKQIIKKLNNIQFLIANIHTNSEVLKNYSINISELFHSSISWN